MDPFDAASLSELHANLRARDVRVPGRTEGRTTELSETWIACRFLATSGGEGLLEFPLRVEPEERPDLVVTMPSGSIGIEITEAVPKDGARVDAYSEHKKIDEDGYIPRYRVGDAPRSRAEIEKIARGNVQKLPRIGDDDVGDWVEAMLHFVARKAGSFAKPGFKKHPGNWLLVYDNWTGTAGMDEELAMERLDQHIFAQVSKNPFSRIFVLRPRSVLEFAPRADVVRHPIPENWLGERPGPGEARVSSNSDKAAS